MSREGTRANKTSVSVNRTERNQVCTTTFEDRILEVEIDPNRFIPAKPGTKRPAGRWRGTHPDDVGRDSLIETGNGLVVLDVDYGEETPQWVRDLIDSNPTLSVQSPHAEGIEGHYLYLIDEAPFHGNERGFNWGEVKYGSLVVTPGSEVHGIRGGKDCKHGCCSEENPGQYTVKRDLPIAPIEADDLPDFHDEITEEESNPGNFDSDLEQRIEHGRECNEKFDDLCRWASKGTDRGDRSAAECALATHLAFWLERDKGAVRKAMNYFNPPKWSEEGPGYRESVLKAVDVQQDSYEQGGGQSGPSQELTFEVHLELVLESPQKTAEVADHVDYSRKQTKKALDYLSEKGKVEYRSEGRSGAWHLLDDEWGDTIISEVGDELNSIGTRDEYLAEIRNHEG